MTDLKNNLEEVWIQKGSFGYVVVNGKDSNPEWINRPFQACSIFVLNKAIQEYQKEIELLKIEKDEFKKYSTMWFDKKNELEQELQKTREQLEIAEKVIEFYGKENHWLGLTDKVPFDVLKWIRMVEDDMDENNLGGIRARQYFEDKDKQGE